MSGEYGMIMTILLLIIYLAFVSLGLPDGVMGVAWPEMRRFLESRVYFRCCSTADPYPYFSADAWFMEAART